MEQTTLYLVRHGETVDNVKQLLQGISQGHLTELGRKQASELADEIAGRTRPLPQAILTSDLQRAKETTNIINERLQLGVVETPLLRERDWGELTLHPVSEAKAMKSFPPSVESMKAMKARAKAFLSFVEKNYRGQVVLAVSHGLFIRCVQALIEGVETHQTPRVQNCELRKFTLIAQTATPATQSDEDIASAD